MHFSLREKQGNDIKLVIQKIRFLTGFASNIQNILTKKGDFGGVKTHGWHTFIKVIIYIYNLCLVHLIVIVVSYLETNNDLLFVTVRSTSISPI